MQGVGPKLVEQVQAPQQQQLLLQLLKMPNCQSPVAMRCAVVAALWDCNPASSSTAPHSRSAG